MGFFIIKGTFHVVNYSPDGDSIRFRADNADNWLLLGGPRVALNGNGHAQLRLEAIDTLETHYNRFHQPLDLALGALDFLLARLNITNVQWNDARTRVLSADDGTSGFILARKVERNNRPISFVFAGNPPEEDGTEIFFSPDLLRRCVNYESIAAGMAYPTYYQGLFPDLRESITVAAINARMAGNGIWGLDRTTVGFDVPDIQTIENNHVILPKLFRRLADYLQGGGTVADFKDYLRSRNERVTIVSTTHFTHFDTVIKVDGNVVKMTEPPENLVFAEG